MAWGEISPYAVPAMDSGDKSFYAFNAVVSTVAVAFLGWLLLLRSGGGTHANLAFMPAVNATLNAIAAVCLVLGYRAIRAKRRETHQRWMVAAFGASSTFLVGYVLYHYAHGDTKYVGDFRALYLAILISHVVLSIVMLPMILTTFYLAWKQRFASHRRLARWTLPVWLYVSVTGVMIYFMLKGAAA